MKSVFQFIIDNMIIPQEKESKGSPQQRQQLIILHAEGNEVLQPECPLSLSLHLPEQLLLLPRVPARRPHHLVHGLHHSKQETVRQETGDRRQETVRQETGDRRQETVRQETVRQ